MRVDVDSLKKLTVYGYSVDYQWRIKLIDVLSSIYFVTIWRILFYLFINIWKFVSFIDCVEFLFVQTSLIDCGCIAFAAFGYSLIIITVIRRLVSYGTGHYFWCRLLKFEKSYRRDIFEKDNH